MGLETIHRKENELRNISKGYNEYKEFEERNTQV
jgi:hypothetical protein